MAADPEVQIGIKDFVMGILGLGGAGGGAAALRSIGRYEQRVETLEGSVKELKEVDVKHDERMGKLETTLSALDERSKNAETSRDRIEGKLDTLLTRMARD